MRLDKHPKSVVCIMSAIGLFVIGVVLTLAFFGNTTLLGVGVAMAVLGGAGAILGCINLLARRSDQNDDEPSTRGIAPPRIPHPKDLFYGESHEEANQGALYYEPCTSSPPRTLPHADDDGILMDNGGGGRGFYDPAQAGAGGIIYVSPGKHAAAACNFPLSPIDRRSYPVPTSILQGGASPIPGARLYRERDGEGGAGRGFYPNGQDASVATQNVDPISLSRNFAANTPGSHPWQQGPPPPGMVRRAPPLNDANVSMRTPYRGNEGGGESWSPLN